MKSIYLYKHFTTKNKQINTTMFEEAKPVPFRTWYQLYLKTGETIGFATRNGYIVEHPAYTWKGRLVSEYREVLPKIAFGCVKIAEQCLTS